MASKPSHDSGYKQLFSHPQMVRDLLLGFVPGPWLKSARFDTLERINASYVSESEQHRHNDMVWRLKVGRRWVWVYLLIEFQSKADKWMAVRMMAYVSLLAQSLIKQKQLQQGKLPALIPLVLYNGQARWTAPTDVAHCFDTSRPGLAKFRPRLMYHLVDEARLNLSPSTEVRNLVDAVFQLERSQDFDTVGRLVEALQSALQAPGQNELQCTLNDWLRAQISQKAPPELHVDVANALARIPDLIEGPPMLADTMGRLFTEALQKGLQKGRKEGREEGIASLLTQQIEQRFSPVPDWARARIQSARPDQLALWGQLILTAPSLEALFEPDNSNQSAHSGH